MHLLSLWLGLICDSKYQLYRDGYGLKSHVENLLKASGVDLRNGVGFQELGQFQDHISDYQMIVWRFEHR